MNDTVSMQKTFLPGSCLAALLGLLCILCFALPSSAQTSYTKWVDEISFDTRASFHQQLYNGDYTTHFQGEYLNLHIKGKLSPRLSYRVRQRFTKHVDAQNPFNATDFLWIDWRPNTNWSFVFGKQPILMGGYEFDSAPIDVYYYSAFANALYQYYAFGVSAHRMWDDGQQDLAIQFIPSPVSSGLQDAYSLNLYWNGRLLPWWRTLWSTNLVEDQYHRILNYITFSNKFVFNKFFVDVDLMNRASFEQKQFFFSDWSLIIKGILTLGKWNLCTKFGMEQNDAANVNADGLSYDLALPAGSRFLYGGVGVEYFPLGNDNLRLHIACFRDNFININNLDMGITWRFRLL